MSLNYHFRDADTMIDRLHALLQSEPIREKFVPPLREDDYLRLELALHEWLANLVQHARFGRREPEAVLQLRREGRRVLCTVDDNSEGFDFNGNVRRQRGASPERERGRGLLILKACTQRLTYQPAGQHKQRLAFYVSAEHDPCAIDIPS